jgi:hypothetical protein
MNAEERDDPKLLACQNAVTDGVSVGEKRGERREATRCCPCAEEIEDENDHDDEDDLRSEEFRREGLCVGENKNFLLKWHVKRRIF